MQWEQFPWEKSIYHFARILGASHLGDINSAEKDLARMALLHSELNKSNDQYKANQVMIQIKTSQAWIEFAKGNNERALSLMIESAEMEDNTEKHPLTPGEVVPARELLGDLLTALDRPSDALIAYEENIESRPGRFNSVYGAAIAAKNLADQEKAAKYFEELLKLAEGVKSDRFELEEAREFIAWAKM
jgi:tetratricopeptide (TPR) repeat protein